MSVGDAYQAHFANYVYPQIQWLTGEMVTFKEVAGSQAHVVNDDEQGRAVLLVPMDIPVSAGFIDHEVGHLLHHIAARTATGGGDGIVTDLQAIVAPGTPSWLDLSVTRQKMEIVAMLYQRAFNPTSSLIYPELMQFVTVTPFPEDAVIAYFKTANLPIVPAVAPAGPRYCYDSTTARDIPADAEIVAGYIDGLYRWSAADWALFPNALKVRIAIFASTNDGHVGDVEPGCMSPDESVGWVQMRRADGIDPTIYCGISQWGTVRDAFVTAGVTSPHFWVAHYDNDPTPLDGAFAKQYANSTFTGYHYDLSVVVGPWPGLEEEDMDAETKKAIIETRDMLNALAKTSLPIWLGRLQNGLDVATGEPKNQAAVTSSAPPMWDLTRPLPPVFPLPYTALSGWHNLGAQPFAHPGEVVYTVDVPGSDNRETFIFSATSWRKA